MKAMIFEGGESIDETNEIEMPEWTPEAVEQAFVDYSGKDWLDDITDMFGGGVTMRETIEIINSTMAQSVKDPDDGGQIYLVRLSD